VWSERAGPFSLLGPKRAAAPGVAFDDLPPIDAVLLSHNHYDHLDLVTLRRLVAQHNPLIVTPFGNDAIVRRAIPQARLKAGDWWDRLRLVGEIDVTLLPAQHWSARGLLDRRMALWCGFALQTGGELIYFAGDTGYGDGSLFSSIRERVGRPDLALLPIGAYAPRWFMADHHIDPAEAVRIFEEMGAAQALAIHWGVFRLSDESRNEPPERLLHALAERGIEPDRFRAAEPGFVWDAAARPFS
jgi:L-ascorbate metabolism protein UlaG (beta-lactamase superfamily)